MKTIYYLTPSSFCFGVERAITGLYDIIKDHPNEKVYCIHALVHNPKVTQDFEDKGVIFVESTEEIPETDVVVVFSAHWTNRSIINQAKKKFSKVYNLECPFVSKIYKEADVFLEKWIRIFFYIGKQQHQESRNIVEYIRDQWAEVYVFENANQIPELDLSSVLAVLSQTTLNFNIVQKIFEDVQEKYVNAQVPLMSDVCRATLERQKVILENVDKFDAFIVIWGKQSSNTKELYKIWLKHGKDSFYWESLDDILDQYWDKILEFDRVALTWGASTPIENIREVYDYFAGKWYAKKFLNLWG